MRGSRAPPRGQVLCTPADAYADGAPNTRMSPRRCPTGGDGLLEPQLRMGESMRHSLILLAAASATALTLSGCARNEAAEPKAAPLPQVSVAPVISRKVTES